MGKYNLAVNQMLERKKNFADFINGTVYGGRQVLTEEAMENVSGHYGLFYEERGKKRVVERSGDIRMRADMGSYSLVFANETQRGIHYAMPVRNMLYDALEYTRQLQDLEKRHKESGEKLQGDEFLSGVTKEDRLCPVITTVLYCGSSEWDGSKSLYGMMDIGGEGEMAEELGKYLPDYRINLVHAYQIENPEVFKSCLQQIFSMLKYNSDKKKLYQYVKEHQKELDRMDRVEWTAALTLLGEQKRLLRLWEKKKEEEEWDVCTAIDELIADGRAEGKREGRAEGKREGRAEGKREGKAEGKREGRAEGRREGRAEGKREGKREGRAESVLELLGDIGVVGSELSEKIRKEKDEATLCRWLKLAARAFSVEQFVQEM